MAAIYGAYALFWVVLVWAFWTEHYTDIKGLAAKLIAMGLATAGVFMLRVYWKEYEDEPRVIYRVD